MKPTVVFGAMLLLLGAQPAHAVKLLTPNTNSCRTFVGLMQHFSSSQEALQLVSMSGWVTGFMSGIAEGTNVDILRELDITEITTRVELFKYAKQIRIYQCLRQPNEPRERC